MEFLIARLQDEFFVNKSDVFLLEISTADPDIQFLNSRLNFSDCIMEFTNLNEADDIIGIIKFYKIKNFIKAYDFKDSVFIDLEDYKKSEDKFIKLNYYIENNSILAIPEECLKSQIIYFNADTITDAENYFSKFIEALINKFNTETGYTEMFYSNFRKQDLLHDKMNIFLRSGIIENTAQDIEQIKHDELSEFNVLNNYRYVFKDYRSELTNFVRGPLAGSYIDLREILNSTYKVRQGYTLESLSTNAMLYKASYILFLIILSLRTSKNKLYLLKEMLNIMNNYFPEKKNGFIIDDTLLEIYSKEIYVSVPIGLCSFTELLGIRNKHETHSVSNTAFSLENIPFEKILESIKQLFGSLDNFITNKRYSIELDLSESCMPLTNINNTAENFSKKFIYHYLCDDIHIPLRERFMDTKNRIKLQRKESINNVFKKIHSN